MPPKEKSPLPVPIAVLTQVLQSLHGGAAAVGSDGLPPALHVEVEARQGYFYAGVLASIDEHYNVVLKEATVRRERACDMERFALRAREQAVLDTYSGAGPQPTAATTTANSSSSNDAAAAAARSRAGDRKDAATQEQYVGTVILRSSSLLLIRFEPNAGATAARRRKRARAAGATAAALFLPKGADATAAARQQAEEAEELTPADRTRQLLLSSFRHTATLVKKEIENERKKNREARRKRVGGADAKAKAAAKASPKAKRMKKE